MAIFFTSDHHFQHHNIIKYCGRPFQHSWEMDATLILAWNDTVDINDTVYHLGDFSMNKAAVPEVLFKLHGVKHLICGNHDKPFNEVYGISPAAQNRWQSLYKEAGFATVSRCLFMEIAGQTVQLNHFPYRNPAAPDQRYQEHRPVDDGGWLLHGHQHNPPERRIRQRMIDVGVDANQYKPVSLAAIEQIIYSGTQ